jgi:transposase
MSAIPSPLKSAAAVRMPPVKLGKGVAAEPRVVGVGGGRHLAPLDWRDVQFFSDEYARSSPPPKESMHAGGAVIVTVSPASRDRRHAMDSTLPILAVDLGKFNSVLCWFATSSGELRFRTIRTTPEELRRELTREAVSQVVFEACSQAGWVHDLCESLALPTLVASTTGAAWQWKRVKRKTDRDDALKLARLAALGEIEGVPVPARAIRQWRSLIGLRKRLVSERVRVQNRIRGVLMGQGLPAPLGAKAWTAHGLAGIGQFARPLADCGPEDLWRGELRLLLDRLGFLELQTRSVEGTLDGIAKGDARVALLVSVPGVGVRTAEVIAAYLPDAKRFRRAAEVSAYAGREIRRSSADRISHLAVPRQYQSGVTDRRGRITKRGPRLLRSALVECAWCALRYNGWAPSNWRSSAD